MPSTNAPHGSGRTSDTRPEYAFLGLLTLSPLHGYDLYTRFSRDFGRVWRVSQSQMYAVLKRLESQGFIAADPRNGTSGGKTRRILCATPAGELRFREWLREPTDCSARVFRVEFITRLHFALLEGGGLAASILAGQEARLERELSNHRRILDSIGTEDLPGILSFSFRVSQIEAELAWLRACAAPRVPPL